MYGSRKFCQEVSSFHFLENIFVILVYLYSFVIFQGGGGSTPAKFCSTNWRCSRTVLEHLELF